MGQGLGGGTGNENEGVREWEEGQGLGGGTGNENERVREWDRD